MKRNAGAQSMQSTMMEKKRRNKAEEADTHSTWTVEDKVTETDGLRCSLRRKPNQERMARTLTRGCFIFAEDGQESQACVGQRSGGHEEAGVSRSETYWDQKSLGKCFFLALLRWSLRSWIMLEMTRFVHACTWWTLTCASLDYQMNPPFVAEMLRRICRNHAR